VASKKYYDINSPVNSPDKKPKIRYDSAFLTGREIEVLVLASQGLSNYAISKKLNVTLKPIQNHFNYIYQKLHLEVNEDIQPRVSAVLLWQKAMRDDQAYFLHPDGTIFLKTPYWDKVKLATE